MPNNETNLIRDVAKMRAEFAYVQVKNFVDQNNQEKQKEYKSYVKKLPALIQTNGLSAALAFMFSKGGTYGKIFDQMNLWLQECGLKRDEELMEWVLQRDSAEYRRTTAEIMALLNWMRRFADGMVKK